MEPRLSDHHRSGEWREVGVEPISCHEYSHFKLPAQSAANKHLNSATQHYLTFPWWFKWNCVAGSTIVSVMDTHNFITIDIQNGYWPSTSLVIFGYLRLPLVTFPIGVSGLTNYHNLWHIGLFSQPKMEDLQRSEFMCENELMLRCSVLCHVFSQSSHHRLITPQLPVLCE